MFRWIFVSLLLSACGIAAVWFLVPHLISAQILPTKPSPDAASEKPEAARPRPQHPRQPLAVAMAPTTRGQIEVFRYRNDKPQELTEPIIISDGTLTIVEKQVAPSEKEGVLLVIGTEVREGEVVPPEKQLPDIRLGFLAIPVGNDKPREGETFFHLPNDERTLYRRVRDTDQLEPNKVILMQETRKMRKLDVGDRVQRGQLLALVNPRKQLDDVAMKLNKLNATEFERASSEKQEGEFKRRYDNQERINRSQRGAIPIDTLMETQLAFLKHGYEKQVKAAEILGAQTRPPRRLDRPEDA